MLKKLGYSVTRRPQFVMRFLFRYMVAAAGIILVFKYLLYVPQLTDDSATSIHSPTTPESESAAKITVPLGPNEKHPIDRLVHQANRKFDDILMTQTETLEEAAIAYRKRRGRHPPPGFDKWYEFATSKNGVMIEKFFDQIYHDLEPFWGMPAAQLRKDADDYEMRISIRNHKASSTSDWFWTQIWLNLTSTIEHLLPDMDIALNSMDEPRLVVPAEDIDAYMQKARPTRKIADPEEAITSYKSLPPPRDGDNPPMEWETHGPFWDIARRGCPQNSLARNNVTPLVTFEPVKISTHYAKPHTENGFVSNYTLSTDFCHQPDLQYLEGIFIEPLSIRSRKQLMPLFGGSKLMVNNEILMPAPMYWKEDDRFMGAGGANMPWEEKIDAVSWRGVATGGRTHNSSWQGFQRHRFVSMNNITSIAAAERGERQMNFVLPDAEYGLETMKIERQESVSNWLSRWSDVGFIDLSCFPTEPNGACHYLEPWFHTREGKSMAEQFRFKYMPDIDGNSFSGRYLGFLRSTSLPIKSTLWREWHDDRLIAWKHFVPMDNRFGDYYPVMEYFVGSGNKPGHDHVAKAIALDGQAWANKVLRREDMQIYVARLLLEYARVSSDDRERMGYIHDVLK